MQQGSLRTPLVLPPLFSEIACGEGEAVFERAVADAGVLGAGTLLHGVRGHTLSIAVVLEPDEPLISARRAFFIGMVAIRDALASHCPPERDIRFAWPDTVLYDGARLGGGRMAWPNGCPDREAPAWIVLGIDLIRTRPQLSAGQALLGSISLREEEFFHDAELVESFSRHLMRLVSLHEAGEQSEIIDAYIHRLADTNGQQSLADNGDLLQHYPDGRLERRSLIDDLAAMRWLDPKTGEPRL
jgi:biotin-(acetyl-CoA carboxylase) ligase